MDFSIFIVFFYVMKWISQFNVFLFTFLPQAMVLVCLFSFHFGCCHSLGEAAFV